MSEISRVWIDDPWLAEDLGLDPDNLDDRWLYTVDDRSMNSVTFKTWLHEAGLSEDDLDWTAGTGMNISGAEYAEIVEDER